MYKSFWSGSNQIVWSLYLGFSSLELTLVMFGAPSPAAITGHLCFVRTGFPGSMALTSQDTVTRLVAVVTGRINELLQRHVVSRVSGGLKQRWSVIRAGLEPCTACLSACWWRYVQTTLHRAAPPLVWRVGGGVPQTFELGWNVSWLPMLRYNFSKQVNYLLVLTFYDIQKKRRPFLQWVLGISQAHLSAMIGH